MKESPAACPESTSKPHGRPVPSRTLQNVVWNWLGFVCSVAVGFFMAPFTVHHLGATNYGIWVLLVSVVGYMGLLDLGVRGASTYYVARYYVLGEDESASQVASTALAFFGGLGLLTVALCATTALIVDRLFHIPPELVRSARIVLLIGGASVAVSLVTGVFGGVISGLQRFDRLGATDVGVAVVRSLLVVSALLSGYGLITLALIQLVSNALQLLLYRTAAHKLYPELRVNLTHFDRGQLRPILSFGLLSSALHISNAVLYATDSFVIGAFLPVSMVTFFSIPGTLRGYAGQVVSAVANPMTPRASSLRAQRADSQLREVVLGMCAMASLIIMPIAITLLVRGRSFISLWMGAEYAPVSAPLLTILALPMLFAGTRQIGASVLSGINQHKTLVPFYVAEAVLNLSLSLYWVRSLGVTGVALGTAIPTLVTTLLAIPFLLRTSIGVDQRTVWLRTWIRPGVAMMPFLVTTMLVERYWPATQTIVFFAQVFAALPLAVAGAWLVALSPDQKTACLAVVSRLRRSVRFRTA